MSDPPCFAEDVRRLRVALRQAIEEMEDMVPYVPEYFREKWEYDATIARLKVVALETGAL
jgi:hypothetical protein